MRELACRVIMTVLEVPSSIPDFMIVYLCIMNPWILIQTLLQAALVKAIVLEKGASIERYE